METYQSAKLSGSVTKLGTWSTQHARCCRPGKIKNAMIERAKETEPFGQKIQLHTLSDKRIFIIEHQCSVLQAMQTLPFGYPTK